MPSRSSFPQRAERPTAASALALYRSLRRINPSPYFLLELDGISPSAPRRRPSSSSGGAGFTNPIAGTTSPGPRTPKDCLPPRRTRRSTSCSSTSAATTPRASARSGTSRPLPRSGALFPCHAPRLRSRRELLAEPHRLRSAPRLLPCRDGPGRPEGEGHADHLGSSRDTAAARTRVRWATRSPTVCSTPASPSAPSPSRTGWRGFRRRAQASSPTPTPLPSTRSALRKLAALEAALDDAEQNERARRILLVDNYDSFTYNLAYLFQELGAEVIVPGTMRWTQAAERMTPSHLVISLGPGRPEEAGASVEIVRWLGRACRHWASASATR